jgi:hypothetical protein
MIVARDITPRPTLEQQGGLRVHRAARASNAGASRTAARLTCTDEGSVSRFVEGKHARFVIAAQEARAGKGVVA